MLVIGLTGGIGSGKSTVAGLLAGHGAQVIDVDAVGREVIAPGGRAAAPVLREFGDAIADADGHIDRASLAKAVFGNPEALARLSAISHPAINETLVERIDALPEETVVVLDMAILVESNLGKAMPRHAYTKVIAVEAPDELRIARAVARGMQEADVRRRIASQATDAERRAVADIVVHNADGIDELTAAVAELWRRIETWR